jgi:AP2-like factor (euAP2 lineage)
MVEIQLPHGYLAVIDDEDEARVRQHRWRPLVQGHTVYAVARLPRLRGKQRSVYMHRLIVEAKPRERVAHRDRNGLNNTRANLDVRNLLRVGRRLSAGVRMSKYQGVAWDAESAKWEAMIGPPGASVRIGLYGTEEAAARAYDEAAFSDCPALRGIVGNFRDEAPPRNRGTG